MIESNRRLVNFLNIVITFSVILVAVKVSDGIITSKINEISTNLDRALNDVINSGKEINYTDYKDNATYQSDAKFSPRGMAGLYNFTNSFMDLVMPNISYVINLFMEDGKPNISADVLVNNWKDLLAHYWGLLTVIVITLLILIFMPLCGLCFCCCRCCGKCGARSQPADNKHDLCRKIILATLLIGLGTALLFGVVCAFVTNQQLHEGTKELTKNTRNSVDDSLKFLSSVTDHFDTLLNTNFYEFNDTFCSTLLNGNDIVFQQLTDLTNANIMTEDIAILVNNTELATEEMRHMKILTNELRVDASQLNDALRKVKRDLLNTLHKCSEGFFARRYKITCDDILKNVSRMETSIDFNSLPELTEEIDLLADFETGKLKEAIKQGEEQLINVNTTIHEALTNTFDNVKGAIGSAGNSIQKQRLEAEDKINIFKDRVNNTIEPQLSNADEYIKQYEKYGYYTGLAMSCVILLVSIFIALGLICGVCGKRPDVYGDDCCNKGAGSQFLICGVFLMFFFGTLFALFVLPAFLVGTLSQKTVCDSMRNPDDNNSLLALVEDFWNKNINTGDINISVTSSLRMCHKNSSIYEVLGLKNVINIEAIKNYSKEFKIDDILKDLTMSDVISKLNGTTILNDEAKTLLEKLGNLPLDINFDAFIDELNQQFVIGDLHILSDNLQRLINDISNENIRDNDELVKELKLSKLHIDTYQTNLLDKIIENANTLINSTKLLETYLKPNGQPFNLVVHNLTDELATAQNNLNNCSSLVTQIAQNFSKALLDQTEFYLTRIVDTVTTEVGKCGPLSLAINGTLTATCDKIILPFNGFWFVLFWSILLFIPIIIVSVNLATLYQKYSPYSGTPIETEYLYDAYAERDSIPLNSNRGKPNKKKNKKYKRYEDRNLPNIPNEVVPRDYAGGSHPPDARYADMAPKHWEEFPAGGPPQYQRAPTEYERPPPYYYPGTGDHQ